MTATELLAKLRTAGCNPAVDGESLTLDSPPPAELAAYVEPLQTGLRAILCGRTWYYTAVPGPHRAGGEVNPAGLLPWTTHLLTVEGDSTWDRVCASWKDRVPEIFNPPKRRADCG